MVSLDTFGYFTSEFSIFTLSSLFFSLVPCQCLWRNHSSSYMNTSLTSSVSVCVAGCCKSQTNSRSAGTVHGGLMRSSQSVLIFPVGGHDEQSCLCLFCFGSNFIVGAGMHDGGTCLCVCVKQGKCKKSKEKVRLHKPLFKKIVD